MAPDAPTIAALGAEVVRPAFLAFLDIGGDPIRATTWETSLTIVGTGDPDLDGYTFSAVDPKFASISPVKRQTGGADTVTASLSGIVGPDSDLLNILGDETKWKGGRARLWFILKHEDGSSVGAFVPYFKGRMVDWSLDMKPTTQTVNLLIESWLAILTDASNSTYLNQGEFDPRDTSAALTIAVANGSRDGTAGGIGTSDTASTYMGQAY